MGKKLSETIKENIEIETPKKKTATAVAEPVEEVNLDAIAKALTAAKGGVKGIKVSCMNDVMELPVPRFISSGDFIYDMCSGGGVPLARATEIIGKESCGKTSLAMSMLNTMLIKEQGYALLFDKERVWEFPTRNVELGLPKELAKNVMQVEAQSFEAVFDTVETWLKLMVVQKGIRRKPLYVIVDSVAAICSEKERGSEYGDVGYQDHSRIIAQAHRKLWGFMMDNNIDNVAIIYVNQAKDAFQKPGEYGPPSELATFGGRAVKFFSSIRVELTKSKQLTKQKGDNYYTVGVMARFNFIKNKVFFPLQKGTMRFMGRSGNDPIMNIFDWATRVKLITKTPADKIKAGELPFRIKLNDKDYFYFDSVKTFRDGYQKNASAIEGVIRDNYIKTLNEITDSLAGLSDEPIDLEESAMDSKEPTGTIEL